MALSVVLASLLAFQPAGALAYLPIPSGDPGTLGAVEVIVRGLDQAGPLRLRRSAADPAALARCVDDRALIDHVANCIRRQLPRRERGLPLVAMLVENVRVSNVTGSQVHTRHNIYCIGHRSIARAEMGDRLRITSQRVPSPAPVRACLAGAASPAPLGALRLTGPASAPLWRVPAGAIAEDAPMARGSSAEHATVRIESRRALSRLNCVLAARVVSVDQGERLREGDHIRLATRCAAARAIRPGARARLYIGHDGGLHYFDPL